MRYHLYRCDEMVYNIKKNRYFRCNNGIYRYLKDKKFCWCHYNKYVVNCVIILQKNYRGYRTRRFMKIYSMLPDDIQVVIKRKINSKYYYTLHCNSIYKILKNRYNTFNNIIPINNKFSNLSDEIFLDMFYKYIYNVYFLYNKYFDIITTTNNQEMLDDVKLLHIQSYDILNKIRTISQAYFYDSENSYIDGNNYNKLINSIFIINTLSEKYESV